VVLRLVVQRAAANRIGSDATFNGDCLGTGDEILVLQDGDTGSDPSAAPKFAFDWPPS
jgi:hypothetical protein